MKKDAFYFPHYCNARHDRKIKRVIKELGVEGYGIYFMLLEVLREQTDFRYPIDDIDLLADEFGTSEQKVRTVICNYHLFETDLEERFFSIKMIYYLQPYIEKTERARLAANIRWGNAQNRLQETKEDANAMQMQCDGNASKGEESKGEESKGEERDNPKSGRFTPPTRKEVGAYCLEGNYCVDPGKFIDYYESNGWMVGKSKMKDWKAAVRNWDRREDKSKPKNQNFSQSSISSLSPEQLNEIVERKRAKKNNADT